MKYILTIIITLTCFYCTDAQQTKSTTLTGINTFKTFSFDHIGNSTIFNTNANFTINKHEISSGPCFILIQNHPYRNHSKRWIISGISLIYNFYPNSYHKVIDFYLQFNFIYQRFNNKFENWTYRENSYETYLGCGFKIKILKTFYINQCNNFGILGSHQNRFRSNHINFYNLYGVGYLIKIGIGYQFKLPSLKKSSI